MVSVKKLNKILRGIPPVINLKRVETLEECDHVIIVNNVDFGKSFLIRKDKYEVATNITEFILPEYEIAFMLTTNPRNRGKCNEAAHCKKIIQVCRLVLRSFNQTGTFHSVRNCKTKCWAALITCSSSSSPFSTYLVLYV